MQADRAVSIAGSGQVPANAVGISYSTAMVNHASYGFFSIWPGGAWPGVSQGLFNPGTSGQTAGLVKVGGDGQVHLLASSPVDLAFDIDGYFASTSGLGFVPTEFPDRLYDSRDHPGHFASPESTVNVQIAGGTGANGITVPWNAEVVVCTATVIRYAIYLPHRIVFLLLASRRAGVGGGIVAMWPAGQAKPWVSALQQVFVASFFFAIRMCVLTFFGSADY